MGAALLWPLMMRRNLIAIGVAAFLSGVALLAAAPPPAPGVEVLHLTATPLPLDREVPGREMVGELRYLGGLALVSSNKAFGGLSGLRAGPGGRLLAISDTGNWVSFVTIEKDERLVGVGDGVIAPLLDQAGRSAVDKEAGDAEAVEWNPATGDAMVSFEGDHRIQHYRGIDPARPETLAHPAASVTREPETAGWPTNGGGEAMAALGDGSRIIFEEDGEDADGWSPALLVKGGKTQILSYRRPFGFKPTDAVEIAPGELLVLNRRVSLMGGFAASLVRVTVGKTMEPVEIARLTAPMTVDNMEGLAIRKTGGRTFVYLCSDDNFFGFQRNLLLKFELVGKPGKLR